MKITQRLQILNLKNKTISHRLGASVQLMLPLLAGTALAYHSTKTIEPVYLLLSLFYGVLIQFYKIVMHDYSVSEAEIRLPGYLPLGSLRKRITEKYIEHKFLPRVAAMAAAGIIIFGGAVTIFGGRTYTLPFLLLTMLLFHAYYFYPFHLYYRGLGETLEIMGAGMLLPLAGYHLGGAPFTIFSPFVSLIPVLLMSAVNTLANGIRDFPTDMLSGKKTLPLFFGTAVTRGVIIGLLAIGIAWSALFFSLGIYHIYALLPGAVMPFFLLVDIIKECKTATHEYPDSLKKFMRLINYSIICIYLGLILGFISL